MELRVKTGKTERVLPFEEGETLLSALARGGFLLPADCGGRGTCGKCLVRIEGERAPVLACRTPARACTVLLEGALRATGEGLCGERTRYSGGGEGFALAVDVGTTTLAYALCDLAAGRVIARAAERNAQASFGADVLSRISAAEAGNAEKLSDCVRGQIAARAARFSRECGAPLRTIAVCGNTAMLHLLRGAPVGGLARAPFAPAFLRAERLTLAGLPAPVLFLPCASAFLGADAVAAAVAAGLDEREGALVDLGTNGELLVNAGGQIYGASAAAGPCFEGASIECGMGGLAGAISSVRAERGRVVYTTVDGAPARGICGAGLIDAVATFLDAGVIDAGGRMPCGRADLAEGVYLTQKDVRAFQLAKAAVRAGLEVLFARAGRRFDDIFVAGGLGFYLNGQSAKRVGLFPAQARLLPLGNAALDGTAACLFEGDALARAQAFADRVQTQELASNESFNALFLQYMGF